MICYCDTQLDCIYNDNGKCIYDESSIKMPYYKDCAKVDLIDIKTKVKEKIK